VLIVIGASVVAGGFSRAVTETPHA